MVVLRGELAIFYYLLSLALNVTKIYKKSLLFDMDNLFNVMLNNLSSECKIWYYGIYNF